MLNALAFAIHPSAVVKDGAILCGDYTITCNFTGKVIVEHNTCGMSQIVGNASDKVETLAGRSIGFIRFCCS